jgi:hypothetical protein
VLNHEICENDIPLSLLEIDGTLGLPVPVTTPYGSNSSGNKATLGFHFQKENSLEVGTGANLHAQSDTSMLYTMDELTSLLSI